MALGEREKKKSRTGSHNMDGGDGLDPTYLVFDIHCIGCIPWLLPSAPSRAS